MRINRAFLALLPAAMLAAGCSSPAAAPQVRTDRQAAYLKENASGYEWFANAADGYGGVPLVLLRSLPDLAPEIFGKPEEQFARFGYLPNPDGPLPLGLSWDSMDPAVKPGPLHPVALTCGACHIGRVTLDDGTAMTLVGGPNTQFDVRMWRKAFESMVHKYLSTPADVSATAARWATLVAGKPPDYFYRHARGVTAEVEAGERQYVAANAAAILTSFAGRDPAGRAGHQQAEGHQLRQGQRAAARWRQPGPVRRQRRPAAATAAARHRDQRRAGKDDGGIQGHALRGAARSARHVHRHPQHVGTGQRERRPGGWQRQVAVLPQHCRQPGSRRRSEAGEPAQRGDHRALHQPAAPAALPVRHRCRGGQSRQGNLRRQLRGLPPELQRHGVQNRSDRHRSQSLAGAECRWARALSPPLRRRGAGGL